VLLIVSKMLGKCLWPEWCQKVVGWCYRRP